MKIHQIFEAQRLLLELRADWVVKNMGDKLEAHYSEDKSVPIDIKAKIKSGSAIEICNFLSGNNKYDQYLAWIAKQYLLGLKLEDVYKVHNDLDIFKKFQSKMPIKDINQVKSVEQLFDMTEPFEEEKTTGEVEKEVKDAMASQSKIIANTPEYLIVVPKTKAASCYWGKNTKWCSSATKNNQFDLYNNDGDLIIILLKKENKRWQFHFQSSQFMDEKDREINLDAWVKQHQQIWDTIIDYYFGTEGKCLAAVTKDGSALQFVPKAMQTEKMCLAAVTKNGLVLQFIPKAMQTEKVCLAAITQDGSALQYVPEEMQTEKICLAAVTKNGLVLQIIPKAMQTEKVCLAAVTQNGWALQYVPEEMRALIKRKLQK